MFCGPLSVQTGRVITMNTLSEMPESNSDINMDAAKANILILRDARNSQKDKKTTCLSDFSPAAWGAGGVRKEMLSPWKLLRMILHHLKQGISYETASLLLENIFLLSCWILQWLAWLLSESSRPFLFSIFLFLRMWHITQVWPSVNWFSGGGSIILCFWYSVATNIVTSDK